MSSVSMYSKYPRIVGYPIRQKIIHTIDELNNHIKEYISKCDIHISLYSFSTIIKVNGDIKPDYESAHIDKIFFDVDEGNWVQGLKDLHYWCRDRDLLHRIHLSSYLGGQFFIGCKPQIQFKKTALHNFQSYLANLLGIEIDKGLSTLGDIARSFRVEKTFNYKRQCYCNPIFDYELEKIGGINDPLLKKLTEKPRKEKSSLFWSGHKLLNLKPFDVQKYLFKLERKTEINIDSLLSNEEIDNLKIPVGKFPRCIRELMSKDYLGYNGRYLLTLYLRDQAFIALTNNQVVSIIKSIVGEEEWIHCSSNIQLPGHNPGENLLPIRKTLSTLVYTMPSCFQLEAMGLCPEKCGRWHPIYK